MFSANGAPAQGAVVVSWDAFTTAAGNSVAAGTTAVTLGANGTLSIALTPNAGSLPTGSYYTAVFHLSDGTTSRQYWVIPATTGGATVKLAAVETSVLPASVAVQTVSKSYVDAAIARVSGTAAAGAGGSTGTYVLKTGDTMTGALLLPSDPVSALQAADKNYVDTAVAQVGSGGATKVSTVPTAAQTVAQPANSQLEVNRLNGVLDATGFLTGNGSNGIGNALGTPECATAKTCSVEVSSTYPGGEPIPGTQLVTGDRVLDHRGGGDTEVFSNPLNPTSNTYGGSTLVQFSTTSATDTQAARPGLVSSNSYVQTLQQIAPAGGVNQFPASHEHVPYGKSNYGVLQLNGTYNTEGQHVQFNNDVSCYSVGDCLAGGQFITSSGGYRDEADEGTHPFDLQISEDPNVFSGVCGSGCTTGSTAVVMSSMVNGGTQGEGRFLIDKNPR